MFKIFKTFCALVILGALTGCTNIMMDEEASIGVNWWLTAVFFFMWLLFSCPLVSRFIEIMSGNEQIGNSEEDWENKKTIAATSVYAFPIMFVTSFILGTFFEWYINYIISIIVGFSVGAIISAKIDPLCNKYIHKTKWLWIAQGVLTVVSIMLAL